MIPSLTSYIPMDRRQGLANEQTLPEYMSGSVLFADISGFTPLTDALTKELGQTHAAEAMTQQLNHFYTALIAEVHRYRGSVIGFVGDAITCWFDDATGLPATACALAMQQAMTQFREVKTSGGVVIELAIKVAVVTGAVCRFVVGDPDIQLIDAMAGQTLDKMARAEKNANRGEVLIAEDIVRRFAAQLTIKEWREDSASQWRFAVVSAILNVPPCPWPDLPEIPAKSWLLPPVYERLMAGQGDFLAEFRPATALFLRFTGLNYEHDSAADANSAASQKLDRYIRWVQTVLARYEGYLIQLTIGDKGSFLYAAFGAPIAHHDDAIRAVRAAQELIETPADFSFLQPVQIGLASGLMRTGSYGSPMRQTYGVISDKTVLAARLMGAAAPGGILCDVEVYRHAQQVISFETLEPIRVKGKRELVQIYRPTRELVVRATRLESKLVGRQQEVACLNAVLNTIQSGGSQVLILQGEAGIGKSRLVAELTDLLRLRGLRALLGAGQSIEQQTPYRVWYDILVSYFDLDEVKEQNERGERVAQLVMELVPEQRERLPLLNDMLNLGFEENNLTASLSPKLRQESLSLLVVALLRAWTKLRPLIIVLEDAHWLDSLSWQLAQTVTRGLSVSQERILLLLVMRPLEENSLAGQSLRSLQEMQISQTLTLETLSPTEIVELVANRINAKLPPSLAELVQSRANGNPFFAEELILALRTQGLITVTGTLTEERQCLISDTFAESQSTLPDTLQGLILARIDRLPPEKQSILKVAAVIGRTFAITPLHYVLNHYSNLLSEALRDGLQSLAVVELTNLETLQPELSYIFKHIITQEVAYQTLLFAQRRQLHLFVAEWYESTFADQSREKLEHSALAPYYPLLVHHYHHAEECAQERHYAKLAGERAAAQYANGEAIRYFSRALELTPESDYLARYDLLLARENVYDWQGKREAQGQDLAALTDIVAHLNDNVKKATVSLRQANYQRWINNYPAALSAVQEVIEKATQAGDEGLEVEGHFLWGRLLRIQRDYDAAEQQLQHALTRAQETHHLKVEADSLLDLGQINSYVGKYATAPDYYHRAQSIYQELNEPKDEAGSFVMLAVINMQVGNYSNANKYYKQALDICQIIGYCQGQAIILGNLGVNYGDSGDYKAARDYQKQALNMARQIGNRELESRAFSNLALIHYELGNYELAGEACRQALTLHRQRGDRRSEGYALTYLGHLLAAENQLEKALEAYQKAIEVRRELGEEHLVMDSLAGLARLALRQGETEQALAYVEEILTWIGANGVQGIEFPLQVYLTCYQVLQATSAGDPEALARADTILLTAHTMLQEQATKIKDPAWRRKFLKNVPSNRELMRIWEARSTPFQGTNPRSVGCLYFNATPP